MTKYEGSAGWTKHDTEICDRAEASGKSINLETGKPTTHDDLIKLRKEYQEGDIPLDEFIKTRLTFEPFHDKL